MKLINKLKLLLSIPKQLNEILEKLDILEDKFNNAYIFSDLPIMEYTPNENVSFSGGCPDGCVFLNDISTTTAKKICMKCGRPEDDIYFGAN